MTEQRRGSVFAHIQSVGRGNRKPEPIWPMPKLLSQSVAELAAEIVTLKARIAELEKPRRIASCPHGEFCEQCEAN